MISSDKLLNKEDEERLALLLDDYKNERPINDEDIVWMMDQHMLAYRRYLDSSPDLFADTVVKNDPLMHKLEKDLADFKDASQCFGFDVPEYNDVFMQYEQSIYESLLVRIKDVRPTITNQDQRHAIGDVKDSLAFRAQIAFGTYPKRRFRVPVLTPSTFGAMAGTLIKFEGAVTEVHVPKRSVVALRLRCHSLQIVSWVYPMAQYFLPHGGKGGLPRNITSWLFQEIQNERTSYWTKESASKLLTDVGGDPSITCKVRGSSIWSQITQLLISNIESLCQLEIDLSGPEMVTLRSRPTGALNEDLIARIDRDMQNKLDSSLSYQKLVDKMLDPKLSRDFETKLKDLEGSPWPLRVRSIHHWSSKTVKNAKRDIPKHALMALAEALVVLEYRPKLFYRSSAACFLRTSLFKILNCGLKKPKDGAQHRKQGDIKWAYLDGIEWERQEHAFPADARRLLLEHSCIVDTNDGGQQIVRLLNRILKHKVALMKPGDPIYANMVAPEVADGVYNLLYVCGESWLTGAQLIRKHRH